MGPCGPASWPATPVVETLRDYERCGPLDEPRAPRAAPATIRVPRWSCGSSSTPGTRLHPRRGRGAAAPQPRLARDSCDATLAFARARRADLQAPIAGLSRVRDSLTD